MLDEEETEVVETREDPIPDDEEEEDNTDDADDNIEDMVVESAVAAEGDKYIAAGECEGDDDCRGVEPGGE